jgi:signal transduction histidine kinase
MKHEQLCRNGDRRNGHAEGMRQLTLFHMPAMEPWQILSTEKLPLDKESYNTISECYRTVYDAFLPGVRATPFFTQVRELLEGAGITTSSHALADLVRRAKSIDADKFPDPRKRSVRSSSPGASKLQSPGGAVRMTQEAHNAFANIYRKLLKIGHKRTSKGTGFFAVAAMEMEKLHFTYTSTQLSTYAHYRRRIGDVNFPRLRGSHDIDRMQIAAVERLQALGVMATGLMHEILQPLQVILADAELQQRDLTEGHLNPEKLERRLKGIINQVQSINNVVQHVRTIARGGQTSIGPVKLKTAVDNALTIFRRQLQNSGIQVDTDGIPGDLPAVQAELVGLERIFINLVTNARDAIEETKRGEGFIKVSSHVQDTTVVCKVSDTGTGIASDILSRVFDPYFTTKEVGKGTGMGLTEVLNSMIQFGGRVAVHSVIEQGSEFTLEFQRYEET